MNSYGETPIPSLRGSAGCRPAHMPPQVLHPGSPGRARFRCLALARASRQTVKLGKENQERQAHGFRGHQRQENRGVPRQAREQRRPAGQEIQDQQEDGPGGPNAIRQLRPGSLRHDPGRGHRCGRIRACLNPTLRLIVACRPGRQEAACPPLCPVHSCPWEALCHGRWQGGSGAIVPPEKVRTALVRMRRNFYSDFTAKRFVPRRVASGAG